MKKRHVMRSIETNVVGYVGTAPKAVGVPAWIKVGASVTFAVDSNVGHPRWLMGTDRGEAAGTDYAVGTIEKIDTVNGWFVVGFGIFPDGRDPKTGKRPGPAARVSWRWPLVCNDWDAPGYIQPGFFQGF